MKNYIIIILTLMAFKTNAQEPIKALKVGDRVPESFWQQEHSIYQNGKTTKQNLSAYKGKLLILDFWATWCSNCINSFSKLDSIQRQYSDDLAIILVNSTGNGDDAEKIAQLYGKLKKEGFNLQLPSLVNSELRVLFPHKVLPFSIWLDEAGTIAGFTNSIFLNRENINQLLKRKAAKQIKLKSVKAKQN